MAIQSPSGVVARSFNGPTVGYSTRHWYDYQPGSISQNILYGGSSTSCIELYYTSIKPLDIYNHTVYNCQYSIKMTCNG